MEGVANYEEKKWMGGAQSNGSNMWCMYCYGLYTYAYVHPYDYNYSLPGNMGSFLLVIYGQHLEGTEGELVHGDHFADCKC